MNAYCYGEQLRESSKDEALANDAGAVYVVTVQEAKELLPKLNLEYEGEIDLDQVNFCKVESLQDCQAGSLCIPKKPDVLGDRYRMQFFMGEKDLVLVDESDLALKLIGRIRRKKRGQGTTKETFLYGFLTEFIAKDVEVLTGYERELVQLEEHLHENKTEAFQTKLLTIRRQLLTLRCYYDEIAALGDELETNENGLLQDDSLKYFGIIADRGGRLMSRTDHLLTYAQQLKDAYQADNDARQNQNMQYLTIISTIFFPLTLITGWYGMNFQNMPELENGYPYIIVISVLIIIICVLLFRKKKIL